MDNISRRTFLAGAGGLATAFAIGTPAYASDAAREQRPGDYVDVQLLNITDFHGNLRTPTSAADGFIPDPSGGGGTINVGGAAYLATHLKSLRKQRNSFFFSVGDDWCGSQPLDGKLVRDEGAVEALNQLGLQFATLGNHELDFGVDYLVDHMIHGRPVGVAGRDSMFRDSTGRPFHGINFPYYSANMVDKRTGRTFLKPYNIEWVWGSNGRKYPIGFIHLTLAGTPTGSSSYEPKLTGLDEVQTANKIAAMLKRRGVNALVVSIHDGAEQYDPWNAGINDGNMMTGPALELAAQVTPDVSAIITGHWHWWFNAMLPDPDGNLRPMVEASHAGQMINEINLKLDPHTGEVIRELTVSTNHAVTLDVTPDPKLERIVDYWTEFGAERYALPAGRTTGDFTRTLNANGECTMGDLAADYMFWDANQTSEGRVEFAMIQAKPHSGSTALNGDLKYAKGTNPSDEDGLILYGESFASFGYENPVLSVTLTGEQIRQGLEQQWLTQANGTVGFAPFNFSANVSATFDATQPVGSRVDPERFLIDGRPLDLTKSYRVAGLAYTLLGDDGTPALAAFTDPIRNDRDHEGFIKYLRAMGTISPSALDRITIKH